MSKDIEKALNDLAKAIKNNDAVEKVVVRIEIKKQKSNKAPSK